MERTCYSIELRGLKFYGFHGVNKHEATYGNYFEMDLTIEIKPGKELTSDKLKDAVDYEKIQLIAMKEAEKRSNLLENVCFRVARAICAEFGDRIRKVRVTLRKHLSQNSGMHATPSVTLELMNEESHMKATSDKSVITNSTNT